MFSLIFVVRVRRNLVDFYAQKFVSVRKQTVKLKTHDSFFREFKDFKLLIRSVDRNTISIRIEIEKQFRFEFKF